MRVLAYGEILWDVFPDKKHLGGASLNFAAHLAKHGHTVYPLSALGADTFGDEALQQLKDWHLFTDHIAILPDKQTGKCLVTLDAQAMPSYNLLRDVAYDFIPGDITGETFDVLYFGTLALREKYNRESLKKLLKNNRFGHIFVDMNIRPPFQLPETAAFAAENATILKISLEELSEVARLLNIDCTTDHAAFAKTLAKRYANLQYILVTLGGDGAYILDCKAEKETTCPSEQVEVVSTVGAGDSFSAAFVHQLFAGASMEQCLRYAAKVAAFVVSRQAAVPDYSPDKFQ